MRRVFRWRAIIPLLAFLALAAALWILLLDRAVERAVEDLGTELVGARVDLASADLRTGRGEVVLRGLEVTNPAAPMTNLFEAREIVANLDVRALLEKKIVVETLAVRDVRFGTPRARSGEITRRGESTGALYRQVTAFLESVPIPPLSLEGIAGQVVNLAAISPDSLRTPAQARVLVATADSLRRGWEAEVKAIDPRALVDTAQGLVRQVAAADPLRLGPTGVASLVGSGRSMIKRLDDTKQRVLSLEQAVRSGVDSVRAEIRELDAARLADYAYARSLVRIPSLDEPEISPALFGELALERLRPVLYWLGIAERYLPPGLDPRQRPGPERPRRSGTTVAFPKARGYPDFLLRYGEASLAIGGATAATGAYVARIAGLTTEPSIYGRPLQFVAERTAAAVGPRRIRVAGALDHTSATLRDSVSALVTGVGLPTIAVGAVGARLDLGEGTTQLELKRLGDTFAARWVVRASSVEWTRLTAPAARPQIGTREWAEDFLWRAVAAVKDVAIEAELSGRLSAPRLAVRSNVGDALAASLRREVGAEVQRVEVEVRARVDRLIVEAAGEARARAEALEAQVLGQVVTDRRQLDLVQSTLEQELQKLARGIPGLRIPGGAGAAR